MTAPVTSAVDGAWWLDAAGRSLHTGLLMVWVTVWPLVLGFSLSGVIQAFASRRSVEARLGTLGPASVGRATGMGMVSSSCSYAASAMAKSMVAKGADVVVACIFMFASTNLVIELGLVLVVLMGWQFAASEFVGGIIMIALLAGVGALGLRGRQLAAARTRLSMAEPPGRHRADRPALSERPWPVQWSTRARWVDAATATVGDLTMLRRELAVGFVVAGVLATVVPAGVWNALFIPGHGVWTSLENAVVGPLIAMVSFVCSIANVPLAAALWRGGISFGGVVSFLFADLITLPLLLIYRRFYGTRVMLRMLGVFWLVMSAAGLATGAIFGAAGLVPSDRRTAVAPAGGGGAVTTWLNVIFLVLLAVIYWTYRHRDRWSGPADGDRAIDPVCGMSVDRHHAPASATVGGRPVYLCSDRCRDRLIESSPEAAAAP